MREWKEWAFNSVKILDSEREERERSKGLWGWERTFFKMEEVGKTWFWGGWEYVVKWKTFSRVWLFESPWIVVRGIFQANTGVGSPSLLQGIFPTQGSNPGLQHCRRILYQLSHRGSLLWPYRCQIIGDFSQDPQRTDSTFLRLHFFTNIN